VVAARDPVVEAVGETESDLARNAYFAASFVTVVMLRSVA
jgi:hypothetical protein